MSDSHSNNNNSLISKENLENQAIGIADFYEQNPVIRALVKLIPGGSATEAAVLTQINRIREKRKRAFFDELANSDGINNPELLQSDDFLHCFFSTMRFMLNTRQEEKIRMFARLLTCTTVKNHELSNVYVYEEYLDILDELRYREFQALTILDSFSGYARGKDQNDLQWTQQFWDDFCLQLVKEVGILHEHIPHFLIRICRTGCYEEHLGYYDNSRGVGKLTPIFQKLKCFVQEQD